MEQNFHGSVVSQVNTIIEKAIGMKASDIHLEPYEEDLRLRYRLDGVLQEIGKLSLTQKDAILSRLKIMAKLDIAEKRRPQDGRIRIEKPSNPRNPHSQRPVGNAIVGSSASGNGSRAPGEDITKQSFVTRGETVDLRVSTLPTEFGEKIVLRILDKGDQRLELPQLGFEETNLQVFRKAITNPYGMILVTGPTGSGKTTTLYAALSELNTPEVNITTIEDPIEYNLPGINQTQVRSDIGLTFSAALRAILRQDPNIIMVGEIRDQETAEIAIRSALTGHMVFSTLHTNDAPSAVTRLIDMGVEPFLVASSVRLVMAQRLVRRICPKCRTKYSPTEEILSELDLPGETAFYHGTGCEHCNGTGYRGRIALTELMPMSDVLSGMINRGVGANELQQQACLEGMRTLRESGIEKIKEGVTTPEEVIRETMA